MNPFRPPIDFARLLYQSLILAWSQLWVNKLRSLLTTLGIIIGVASIIAVIAALTGLKAGVLEEFESIGAKKIFIYPSIPDSGNFSWRDIRFHEEQFEGLLRHCPNVDQLTLTVDYQDNIHHRDRTLNDALITGIQANWHGMEDRTAISGRTISDVDNAYARMVCMINQEAQNKLRLAKDCIGQSIYIGNRRFTIIGIMESKETSSMFHVGESKAELFIPFSTAQKLESTWIHAMATSRLTENADEARAEIRFFLRRTRHLQPGQPDTFDVDVVEQYIKQFNKIAMTITLAASGIVSLSLIVGGIGIMNIMLVSVTERTREIGLRKAVGAQPGVILLQFLVESVTLCLCGGLLGVLLGKGITVIMSALAGEGLPQAYIPMWAIGIALGFSAFVGIVFGMFPAMKAARLDPIVALRHE